MIASETEFFINDRPKEKGLLGSFKSIFWNVECVLYKGYSKAISVETQEKKYNVSICAIFKNEAPYLKEWIEFNNIVGVNHFYMYAASIATSTFHGITFSLIFNKKFAFCKTDFIMAKVDDFLKELKLFDLFDKNQDDVSTS